jgi:hypothetical protein
MSNALAIAAVTATLRQILQQGVAQDPSDRDLNDATVTILPPDKARGNNTANQLNLFLYQIQRNAAWVNSDMPRQVRSGETGFPPLPLNLWYLLTAFGRNDDADNSAQPFGHHVLGKAMSILHDHPVLSAAEIVAATQTILPTSDLDKQIERIRITFQPLSVEEIYRLWTGFGTPCRLSAAYEVAVTLIESTQPTRTPLPVLTRGPQDKGIGSVASPPPLLSEALPPTLLAAAGQGDDTILDGQRFTRLAATRLGDDVTLNGQQLNNDSFVVRFSSSRLSVPNDVAPKTDGKATRIMAHLPGLTEDPDAFVKWVPGYYTVSLVINRPNLPAWTTNEVPLALAPVITVSPNSASAGDITLNISCTPRLREEQRVFLLFGDGSPIKIQSLVNPVDTSQPTRLTFLIPAAIPGNYVVRLRVDGVDSLPVVIKGAPPTMAFDPNQQVTVT